MTYASLIVSIVSIIITTITSYTIFLSSKTIASKNYLTKDRIMSDLLLLEGALNSICLKSTTKDLMQSDISIEKEVEFINNFLSSQTLNFVLAYDTEQANQTLYLHLLFIVTIGSLSGYVAVYAKKSMDILQNITNSDLLKKIKRVSIRDCLNKLTKEDGEQNILMKESKESIKINNAASDARLLKRVQYLLDRGVDDPMLELFLLVMSENFEEDEERFKEIAKRCNERYGTIHMPLGQVLEKYKDLLKEYKEED